MLGRVIDVSLGAVLANTFYDSGFGTIKKSKSAQALHFKSGFSIKKKRMPYEKGLKRSSL